MIICQSSVSFITVSSTQSCPVVLDAAGWLACTGMGWPSLLTNQLGCIQHHPLLAPLRPAEPSQATQRLSVDWYSCCCYRWYQTTTRWHARCTITLAICFSIWASQSLNMPAELLMSLTYHQPVLNSAKYRGNVEIPRKRANSVARLKIPCAAENCGPYLWALWLIKDSFSYW